MQRHQGFALAKEETGENQILHNLKKPPDAFIQRLEVIFI